MPGVAAVSRGPVPDCPSSTAPAAVAVHWEVGVRRPPYSSGKRNWRSAVQKWEEVTTTALSPQPPSSAMAANSSPSEKVEQAP